MPVDPPSKETVQKAHDAYQRHGFIKRAAAKELGIAATTLQSWFEIGERLYGLEIPKRPAEPELPPKGRIELDIVTGTALIGSDFHYWPGPPSTGHRAFVHFAKRLKRDKERPLRVVILDGDVCDFAGVSRHPPIGWTSIPTALQEIECAQERVHEIEVAAGKGVEKLWPAGNHDLRMETFIAKNAPELRGIKGSSLVDHFPNWRPCWSVFINKSVVVKHRGRGGVHATWNNVLNAGLSIVTGHLHAQTVRPFTDYRGTRYGVDLGCIADTYAPQFQDYMEDGFRNWRSGFAVLTFVNGEMLPPELVTVVRPGVVTFRGEMIEV